MKTRPTSTYVLLGALMSGPMHGYEILRFLDTGLGPALRTSTSQLYVLLKKLEKDGLISSRFKMQESRPSKRVFSLRPPGKEAFLGWLLRPTEHVRDLRVEFLTKLFFLDNLGLDGGQALVIGQIALLERVKQELEARRGSEKDRYNRLVYGFRIATLNGWLSWLRNEALLFVT